MTDVDITNLALVRIGETQITAFSNKTNIHLQNIYDHARDDLLSLYPWNFAKTRSYFAKKTYTTDTIAFSIGSWGYSPWGYFPWGGGNEIVDTNGLLISHGGFAEGDRVTVTGSNSNDGTYTIVSVTANALILLETDIVIDESIGARVTLERKPAFEYEYSYDLPADYLGQAELYGTDIWFVIERGRLYCKSDEIYLTYNRQVVDPTKFTPLFIDCLSMLLASRLAVVIGNNERLSINLMLEMQKRVLDSYQVEARESRPDEALKDTSWVKH